MAEHPSAVTDTHALVFHAGGRWGKRGSRVRAHFEACEARRALTYVPAAVVWECSLLAQARRIHFGRPVREFFEDLFSNPAYQPLDLSCEQVYMADEARPNDDLFDALICAAARSVGLPLLTRDEAIVRSGLVKTLW